MLEGVVGSSEVEGGVFVVDGFLSTPLVETAIAVRDYDLGPVPVCGVRGLLC